MEMIQSFISDDLIYALGWTVMHSLWQAFIIAIILVFVLNVFQKKSARVRYEASTFALFLVLVSAVSTFIWYFDSAVGKFTNSVSLNVGGSVVAHEGTELSFLESFLQSCIGYFDQHLPMIVLIWLLGVVFFVLRLIGGLVYVQRLRHFRTNELPEIWQERIDAISRRIPIKKSVKILESAAVKVPMVIGYLKPFILLPVGTVNQLESTEVEAIIAHELAHVFRNDFLMNIFISFVEVFFYYNPAVWWISGNIRLERENCCDDIAIKICGNKLVYANALVRLQELNAYAPSFAMPFSGQKNQLLNRIRRILNQPQSRSNILEKLTATCFLFLTIIFMSVNANTVKPEVEVVEVVPAISMDVDVAHKKEIILNIKADTIPDKRKILKGKNLEIIRDADGEISEVIIDGEVISKEELDEYVEYKIEIGGSVSDLSKRMLADSLLWSRMLELKREKNGTAQSLILKSGDKLSSARLLNKREKTITKSINEDGQTIIMVEGGGEEPVEIIVDRSEEMIAVNGSDPGVGDTTIIIGQNIVNWDRFPNGGLADVRVFADTINWEGDGVLNSWIEKRQLSNFDSFPSTRFKLLMKENELQNELLMHELQEKLKTENRDFEKLWIDQKNELAEMRTLENAQILKLKELSEVNGENLHFFEIAGKSSANFVAQKIAAHLKNDGLIKDENDFSFSISRKKLKINGRKQSGSLLDKYIRIYEKSSGNVLSGKAKFEITFKQQ